MELEMVLRNLSILLLICRTMSQVSVTVPVTTYSVENLALANGSVGGLRFEQTLGGQTILSVMRQAKDFIEVGAFSLSPPKPVEHVVLYVEEMEGIAYSVNGTIHLSAGYVESFQPGNSSALALEITGIMFHEMTHILQNNAAGVPGGVIEGIADFIRLSAGFPTWTRHAGGDWDSGYSVTAFFFDWINQTKTYGFVNKLNQKIGEAVAGWDVNVFVELTGTDVNSLWAEYQSSI